MVSSVACFFLDNLCIFSSLVFGYMRGTSGAQPILGILRGSEETLGWWGSFRRVVCREEMGIQSYPSQRNMGGVSQII